MVEKSVDEEHTLYSIYSFCTLVYQCLRQKEVCVCFLLCAVKQYKRFTQVETKHRHRMLNSEQRLIQVFILIAFNYYVFLYVKLWSTLHVGIFYFV